MRTTSVVVALALLTSQAHSQSLHDFVTKQNWNVAQTGPLLVLDARSQWPIPTNGNDQAPNGYAAYARKLVKVGHLNAIVPIKRLDFPDDGLANPYDSLPTNDRFAAFLGSLSPSQWRQLTETGLSPRNLAGQQKQVLMSLIPHPLKAQEFVYQNGGYGSDSDPIPVSAEVAQQTRLQVFKALDVGFGALVDPTSSMSMYHGVSSVTYRPTGTRVYRALQNDNPPGNGGFSGVFVDNEPKISQLNYGMPLLSMTLSLKSGETIAALFKRIREACGIDVYADARVAPYDLDTLGESASISDLLRAIALSVAGTYRRVGTSFVLTSDIDGLAARGTRALVNSALLQLDIQGKISGWRAAIKNGRMLDQLDFIDSDIFQAKSFLRSHNISLSAYGDSGWQSSSLMNAPMKDAIPNVNGVETDQPGGGNRQHLVPDPNLHNKVRFKVITAYRFILPNGIVLDSQSLDLDGGSMSITGGAPDKIRLPLNPSTLKPGSSAGYRTDDPTAMAQFCELAKQHGLKDIWIETKTAHVINVAVASGLSVSLALRPWEILRGESAQTDLNVLGQSGSQLNQVRHARIDYGRNQSWLFSNSCSPLSADLDRHWSRLLPLVSTKGLQRVVLLDPIPGGYHRLGDSDYDRINQNTVVINGVPTPNNLKDLAPMLFEFGYATEIRTSCLQKLGLDPIDLEHPFRRAPYAPIPYFGEGPFGEYNYPRIRFGENDELAAFVKFEKLRHDAAVHALKGAVGQFSTAGVPIFVQFAANPGDHYRSPLQFGPASSLDDVYSQEHDSIEMLMINPLTAEDENGAMVYAVPFALDKPMCFNFSEVKPTRLSFYFDVIFKKQKS